MKPASSQNQSSGNASTIDRVGPHECPHVLGLWDLRKAPLTLGGMIILVEELQAQAMLCDGDVGGVCFIHDASHQLLLSGIAKRGGAVAQLDADICADSVLLSALINLKGVNICYYADSVASVKEFVSRQSPPYVVWPSPDMVDERGRIDYPYGTTLFLQRFFNEHKCLHPISAKPEPIQWAVDLIERHVRPALPVLVHLKNVSRERSQSNANLEEWAAFFEVCIGRHDVKFILIGNEGIDNRIRRLPNIIVTQDLGSSVARDLALIQTACIFMGMASGPCSMAIFSDIPYLICKHPDHHPEQMARELGESDRFSFATQSQKILRAFETRQILMSEFTRLYAQVDRQSWERRLTGLRKW